MTTIPIPATTPLRPPRDLAKKIILKSRTDAGGFTIGRRSGGRNRRGYRSDDFRYDQESYYLNFEEDGANREGELPFSSFAARLPATPPSFVNLNLHLN
ncbi:hypothetical protein LINGRAHAP2_LOCUS10587 [Linum grandiflorum]